jgi:protein O-mannosyl-transferase
MVETTPPAARLRSARLAHLGLAALLVAATIAIYGPALHGGLLVDDIDHITRPEWRSLAGLGRVWFDVGSTSQYFPLLHTAFWLESHLWGDALLGYHLVNVLQHAAAALFLVAIVRRLALPGAWLAGFVFALHPVCVESVAWISEQKNTLSTLFFLAAGYFYLGFDRERRARTYWTAFALFLCALLSKSITATLVPALLVIFWWQRGRIDWRRDVLPLTPWLIAGIAFGLFTAWYERVHAGARGATFDLSLVERTLIAGRAVVFYVRTLLWPADLVFINPRWSIDASAPGQYLFPFAVLGVTTLLAWHVRRQRGPLAAWLIYLGTLLPTLGFLNINWFNYSFVADHFQYLAAPALIVLATVALTRLGQRFLAGRPPFVSFACSAPLLLVLALLSARQSRVYRDGETLDRHTLERNPAAWIAHHNLGASLVTREGHLEEAVAHLLASLALQPYHPRAYINLGRAFGQMPGRLPDAIRAYESALKLDPNNPVALRHLGNALAQLPERRTDAIAAYRRALQLDARTWEVHAALGQLLAADPATLDDAIAAFQTAARLQPHNAALFHDLGGHLVRAGRIADAIAAYETVVRLQPDHADAHYNLGSLLADIPSRTPEAIVHFEAALRHTPDDPAVHNNLGLALLSLPGRRDDALRHFEKVIAVAPDSADGHFNLGRALLAPPADERAALRHFETAARLRPGWTAAERAVQQLRARLR